MIFHELLDVLRTPLQVKRVSVKAGPYLQMEFERAEVLDLESLHLRTERILRMQFIERRVMWEDLGKELPTPAISSLRSAAAELDEEIREMTKGTPPIGPGLIRLLAHWRTGCVLVAKFIEDREREAQANNKTALHHDEFIDPTDYMPDVLRQLRRRAYPVIWALIDTLPEANATKKEAAVVYRNGRAYLREDEKDELTPVWSPSFDVRAPAT